jgi:hypothetical protein
MTDTDFTFLPNYNNMDLARSYVMILTSPPSLPRSRLWAGLGVRWPSQSNPVIQGLPVFESFITFQRSSSLTFQRSQCPWIQKIDY